MLPICLMATVAGLLSSSSYTNCVSSIFSRNESISSSCTFFRPFVSKTRALSSLNVQVNNHGYCPAKDLDNHDRFKTTKTSEKIQQIHCIEEYNNELQFSPAKLVIAHFSATHYKYNLIIQQFMEEQRVISDEVKFLYVMANDSEKTRLLCRRENIDKIPYFIFYRKAEKIHKEAGFRQEKLVGNMLYHVDDPISPVVQLKYRGDLQKLINAHKVGNKLIVVNVGKRNCIPCAKIYPSVIKLAQQMAGRVLFTRMNVDDGDDKWCKQMLREMDVYKVPAFLFLRNGELCGRYIGSCTSTLIREIVKLQSDHMQKVILESIG